MEPKVLYHGVRDDLSSTVGVFVKRKQLYASSHYLDHSVGSLHDCQVLLLSVLLAGAFDAVKAERKLSRSPFVDEQKSGKHKKQKGSKAPLEVEQDPSSCWL